MPWAPPPLSARLVAARRHPHWSAGASSSRRSRYLWPQVIARRRQVVFLGGEPGAGKTRLIAEVAGALHDNDVTVLVGTSGLDGGIPYQPFTEMLDHLFVAAPAGGFGGGGGRQGRELQRLSAHVRRHCPDLGETASGAGEVRRDLFEAVASVFRGLAEVRPLALMIDDLHWAQLPTFALLEHVVQAARKPRCWCSPPSGTPPRPYR